LLSKLILSGSRGPIISEAATQRLVIDEGNKSPLLPRLRDIRVCSVALHLDAFMELFKSRSRLNTSGILRRLDVALLENVSMSIRSGTGRKLPDPPNNIQIIVSQLQVSGLAIQVLTS
jgi:hypothetical protein